MLQRLYALFAKTFYTLRCKFSNRPKDMTCLENNWKNTHLKVNTHWNKTEYLSVDLEMSSLDVNKGEILSIGWVVIRNGKVRLDSAEHHIIHSNHGVGQSATIHQLRDCEIEEGLSITQISERFLKVSTNRVLIFHHAALDMAFLNKASRAIYGAPLLLTSVDTLLLEKAKLLREKGHIHQGDLRLSACRERYNLPLYPAHNALMDAIATAELFIAIAVCKGDEVSLSDVL